MQGMFVELVPTQCVALAWHFVGPDARGADTRPTKSINTLEA
jgi:hypothetical protein